VLQTFMLRMGDYSLHNLTLYFWVSKGGNTNIFNGYPGLIWNRAFWQTLWNSLKLVFVASFLATICGQLSGYVISRGRTTKSGKLIEQLVFIPYLIPSIAFGAMYLSMFAGAKTLTIFGHTLTLFPSLYGTFALLVLVTTVKNLPFASRAGQANMMQINAELEESAQMEGAGFFRRFIKIVLPLSKNGFMSGFMLIFIAVMKELDLLIILVTPSTETLPCLAYNYQGNGMEQFSDAITVVMFLIVFLIYYLANKFFNADITKGF
jgi:iron(III) transport system permease protein